MATMSSTPLTFKGSYLKIFIQNTRKFLETVTTYPITAMMECPFPKANFDFVLLRSILLGEAPFLSFEENMHHIFSSVEITEEFFKYAYTYFIYGAAYSGDGDILDSFSDLFNRKGRWESFVQSCNYRRRFQIKEPYMSDILCSCSTKSHHPINNNKCFFGTSIYFGPIPKCWLEMWDISRTYYLPSEFMARRYKQREDGSHENNIGWYLTQEELDTLEDWPDNLNICGNPMED